MSRLGLKFKKGQKCVYCNRAMVEYQHGMTPQEKALIVTVDHIIPRHLGGTNDKENLLLACSRDNSLKDSIPYPIFKVFSDIVIKPYPDLPTPILRNSLKMYIMHLLEISIHNKKAMRDASTLAMLKLKDEIDRYAERG